MNPNPGPAHALKDPEVKKYFLELLESGLTPEEKYGKFVEFFELESRMKQEVMAYGSRLLTDDKTEIGRIVQDAGEKVGIWNPGATVEETRQSIRAAIRRLTMSQHADGGWGHKPEESAAWETSYGVLCLNSAGGFDELVIGEGGESVGPVLKRGVEWMKEHIESWRASDDIENSAYQVSLGTTAFSRLRDPDYAVAAESIRRLVESQNSDGGWDATIWRHNHPGVIRVFSEVGATAFVIQALAAYPTIHIEAIKNGVAWLMAVQNSDGSWASGSCHPGSEALSGDPSITKTCDGIKGLLAGRHLGLLADSDIDERIDRAVQLTLAAEKPIVDQEMRVTGWGWQNSQELSDLENTALMLETLVMIPSISLPTLVPSAKFLIRRQRGDDAGLEEGGWDFGHTPRIALSLIEFYGRIKNSAS